MTKEGIANTLRGIGLVSILTAATAFGAAAFNPALAEAEIELLGDSVPIIELVGHVAGLSGIAEMEIAKRLNPPGGDGDSAGGPSHFVPS